MKKLFNNSIYYLTRTKLAHLNTQRKRNIYGTKLLGCLLILISISTSLPANNDPIKDSLRLARKEKAREFFSLKPKQEIHQLQRYTTANDSIVPKKENKWGVSLSGFIGVDLFWDTREMIDVRDGALAFFPADVLLDAEGNDLNARPSFHLIALNTRLTVNIFAPDALGAKISGRIEGWFIGVTNADAGGFALRHAFMKMDWKRTSLLIGQTWHPFFTETCFPHTASASVGAPFQALNREPQIRVTQKLGKIHSLMAYASSHMNVYNLGNKGGSTDYLRYGLVPELGLQYHITSNINDKNGGAHKVWAGVGGGFTTICPRNVTEANIKTTQRYNAFSGLAFLGYENKISNDLKFTAKAKCSFSQLGCAYLLMGGYAIKEYDATLPLDHSIDYEYTPINAITGWLDLAVTKNSWEVGLFGGLGKNLGSPERIQDYNNASAYYVRGYNGHMMYKTSVRLRYTANKIQFCFEPEYSSALYATKLDAYGKPDHSAPTNFVQNIRFLFGATLFF